jgi:hypothetical protein
MLHCATKLLVFVVACALNHPPLCIALLRQSNPNWEAYFIVTDDQPFDEELQETLRSFGDYRLNYLPIDMQYRPKVSHCRPSLLNWRSFTVYLTV